MLGQLLKACRRDCVAALRVREGDVTHRADVMHLDAEFRGTHGGQPGSRVGGVTMIGTRPGHTYHAAMGFNPFRPQSRSITDIVLVVGFGVLTIAVVLWAFLG